MADALDSKSSARKGVWVQVPPPVLLKMRRCDAAGRATSSDRRHLIGTACHLMAARRCAQPHSAIESSIRVHLIVINDDTLEMRQWLQILQSGGG